MKFERGSGNVFADLGSSDVEANAAAYADWQAFHAIEIAPHPPIFRTRRNASASIRTHRHGYCKTVAPHGPIRSVRCPKGSSKI